MVAIRLGVSSQLRRVPQVHFERLILERMLLLTMLKALKFAKTTTLCPSDSPFPPRASFIKSLILRVSIDSQYERSAEFSRTRAEDNEKKENLK